MKLCRNGGWEGDRECTHREDASFGKGEVPLLPEGTLGGAETCTQNQEPQEPHNSGLTQTRASYKNIPSSTLPPPPPSTPQGTNHLQGKIQIRGKIKEEK